MTYEYPLHRGVLPESLRKLRLRRFNHPLTRHVLPAALEMLSLGSYNQPLPSDLLPQQSSLTQFELGYDFEQPPHLCHLPPTLKRLEWMPRTVPLIPAGVTELTLFLHQCVIDVGMLPHTLSRLHVDGLHSWIIKNVPHTVTSLSLGVYCHGVIDTDLLPTALRRLTVSEYYLQNDRWTMPPSVSINTRSYTVRYYRTQLSLQEEEEIDSADTSFTYHHPRINPLGFR